eukprot:1293157-Amphidinium_carterae.1
MTCGVSLWSHVSRFSDAQAGRGLSGLPNRKDLMVCGRDRQTCVRLVRPRGAWKYLGMEGCTAAGQVSRRSLNGRGLVASSARQSTCGVRWHHGMLMGG